MNPDFVNIVARIASLPNIDTVGITTNALLLEKKLPVHTLLRPLPY